MSVLEFMTNKVGLRQMGLYKHHRYLVMIFMIGWSWFSVGSVAASEIFVKPLNTDEVGLRGVVDLHTHPMAHLGFGGKVLYGAPDVGIIMPAGAIGCSPAPRRAGSLQEAIGSCYSTHSGHDFFKNPCGNHIRRLVLDGVENANHANKPHDVDHPDGYPYFTRWPKYNDILHQHMWISWLKRAYDGGLRVMAALAINSVTLTKGVDGNTPYDDRYSGDLQLSEMKVLVNRHHWMEIAYSAQDLRRIVGQDKLAVVLGVELTDIGNFVKDRIQNPSHSAIRYEIRRLYDQGVRYVFLVHNIDNYFGGTAVYESAMARANRYHYGRWWQLRCAQAGEGIIHQFDTGWDFFISLVLGPAGGKQPVPSCPAGVGYANSRGLQNAGRVALDEIMRLHMMIDVDHMSQYTFEDTLAYTSAAGYPLISGHAGLRAQSGKKTERSRTWDEYRLLAQRSGLAGVGWADLDAVGFLSSAQNVSASGISIALGSDVNGLSPLPKPRQACRTKPCVVYSSQFPAASLGAKSWDYNTEGMAHYGLLPDFLRDVEGLPNGKPMVDKLFGGAEQLARMWEILADHP